MDCRRGFHIIALLVAGCLPMPGCATGRLADERLSDTSTASAGLADGARQSDIARAAEKDPFPTAAEALGH